MKHPVPTRFLRGERPAASTPVRIPPVDRQTYPVGEGFQQ